MLPIHKMGSAEHLLCSPWDLPEDAEQRQWVKRVLKEGKDKELDEQGGVYNENWSHNQASGKERGISEIMWETVPLSLFRSSPTLQLDQSFTGRKGRARVCSGIWRPARSFAD